MVLYIHPHFTYHGGGSKWVLETASRLSQRGMDVTILAQSGRKNIIKPYKNINFVFFGGPPTNSLKHWLLYPSVVKTVFRKIEKIKPDIIFPHVFPANHWGFLYKKQNPEVKCVWMCHEPSAFIHDKNVIMGLKGMIKYLALASSPILKPIDVELVRKYSDEILTNSLYTSKNVKRIYKKESITVNIGVDTKKYRPLRKKGKIFFTISRLTKFKKIDIAIKAMKILVKKHKDVKFYIGGNGEEKENLIKLTKSLGLEKNIIFLGALAEKDVPIYHSTAIATLFPAVNEPAGIVPLEAMSSGTPIIATKSGGPQDYIIDQKTGFLVKPNSAKSMAEKMEILLTNPRLVERMGVAARKHVLKNYSWDIVVDKLYDIFRKH